MEKYKIFLEGLDYHLVYYLEIGERTSKGNILYSVTLKEKDQNEPFTKEIYEYFKTLAYAYSFTVLEEEENMYTVLSRESEDFHDTFLYKTLGDAFFDKLMN